MMTMTDVPQFPVRTAFLCGKITGDPDYRRKFAEACESLEEAGIAVMNPAVLPGHGFTHEQYLTVTIAMMRVCDAVVLLPDWKDSPGAKMEKDRATHWNKPIIEYAEWRQRNT